MRGFLLLLVALLATATSAIGQDRDWGSAEANRYWPLKAERIEAYRVRDRGRMERLLATDFVGLGPDGRRVTREEYLASEFSAEAQARPTVNTEVTDFEARRTGPTLVLSYREVERVDVAGQHFETRLARLDVYVREGRNWRLRTMTAVRLPDTPTPITLSAASALEYAGEYEFGPGVWSVVRWVDGRLFEQSTGSEEVELIAIGPDEFYSPPDVVARVRFERDISGRVVAQTYISGTQILRAPRVE